MIYRSIEFKDYQREPEYRAISVQSCRIMRGELFAPLRFLPTECHRLLYVPEGVPYGSSSQKNG